DPDEDTYDSEMDAMTGEGSWEEDHGFRFRVAQGSNTDSEDAHGRPLSKSDMTKYAIRARRFANSRPGHARARAGSNVSAASGYNSTSGHGPRGSISSESRSSGDTAVNLTRLRNVTNAVAPMSKVESAIAAAAVLRAAKSLSDLKAKYRRDPEENAEPVPVRRLQRQEDALPPEIKAARRARVIHAEFDSRASVHESFTPRTTKSSISSVSSAESAGSNRSSSQSHSS
ncbi:14745_t:CDS:2, partial [Acaulospora colombiana]